MSLGPLAGFEGSSPHQHLFPHCSDAELKFLPLFLVYFILSIMICFTGRPNDSLRTNSICQRALRRSWSIAFSWSWTGFYVFSIHVYCPHFCVLLRWSRGTGWIPDQFSLPPVGKSHGSPSPTSGNTKKDMQKLKKSTILPALAFSQLISMYQEKRHNIFFWNSHYISCHLGLYYLPVFKWRKRHITT